MENCIECVVISEGEWWSNHYKDTYVEVRHRSSRIDSPCDHFHQLIGSYPIAEAGISKSREGLITIMIRMRLRRSNMTVFTVTNAIT